MKPGQDGSQLLNGTEKDRFKNNHVFVSVGRTRENQSEYLVE